MVSRIRAPRRRSLLKKDGAIVRRLHQVEFRRHRTDFSRRRENDPGEIRRPFKNVIAVQRKRSFDERS